MRDYFRTLIVSSSLSSVILFLYTFGRIDIKKINYDGYIYPFILPLYFGILSVFFLFISNTIKFNKILRLLLTSITSSVIAISIIFKMRVYNFENNNEKLIYPFKNFIGHFLTYFTIIYLLEPLFEV